ncbi:MULTISPECIES: cellulose-binding domain-containing protein [unclassified Streptomyces]|uniref:cellulose-binding domain-containing protein n=1 Tax=unclassified Streptomyces TaxID=2593676 RepID=UPI000F6C18F7|nr:MULTISPECIES: cellulose-binding domain-containing protein [unclassified Streptomyces]AZM59259.1 cellulose-binding protein [Streptomyces sp. WAC 01438]RSM87224.1 cellulose-binding protein [Streptomyces sp. WAC 01420]
MPDLPDPKDASEAALFTECWDAVLSYADLCTAGSAAAAELAREAFAEGIAELRAAEHGTVRGTGRRSSRLPRIPLLLTAVRTTAAAWETAGQGHKLDPDLRLWLHSDQVPRYTGPPLHRPVAVRGLRDLQQVDAELLWLAEAEALPLPLVARRLGLDPATVADELAQVRRLFRDRCHRNHLDSPMDAECRSYARLLDAVTRSPAADAPDDLTRHLATCQPCAEAAACLRLDGQGLPGALAGGVIGWGGLAYLERRRRAAEARLGTGGTDRSDADAGDPAEASGRPFVARHALLIAAVLVSLLALGASLMPFGDLADDHAAASDAGPPVADPVPSAPSAATLPATLPATDDTSPSPSAPTRQQTAPTSSAAPDHNDADRDPDPDPGPQGTSTATATASATTAPGSVGRGAPAACRVDYDLVNQWPDGFQATVTVTTRDALDSWRVGFTFEDGQRITQMWDASVRQDGSHVTASAPVYRRTVDAGGKLAFGFVASRNGTNRPPAGFTLNDRTCAPA